MGGGAETRGPLAERGLAAGLIDARGVGGEDGAVRHGNLDSGGAELVEGVAGFLGPEGALVNGGFGGGAVDPALLLGREPRAGAGAHDEHIGYTEASFTAKTLDDHRKIVAALDGGDANQAEISLRAHLAWSRENLERVLS